MLITFQPARIYISCHLHFLYITNEMLNFTELSCVNDHQFTLCSLTANAIICVTMLHYMLHKMLRNNVNTYNANEI